MKKSMIYRVLIYIAGLLILAMADCIHRSVGFTKNCFDVLNVTITIVISLVCTGRLHGIGIGTVLAVILVGRTIAVFNHSPFSEKCS
jgi:uncharacterized membrane protein YczE